MINTALAGKETEEYGDSNKFRILVRQPVYPGGFTGPIGQNWTNGGIARPEVNQPLYWAKVDKNGPIPAHRSELGPCWNWTAAKNSRGYGCFAINGRSFLTHRIAVVLDGREIPDGLTVDHLCQNIVCVNPGHLEVVTLEENIKRMPAATSRFCKRGHEYTEANTILKHREGFTLRNCRTCTRIKRCAWDHRAGLRISPDPTVRYTHATSPTQTRKEAAAV